MGHERKLKIEQIIFSLIAIAGFGIVGGIAGYFLISILKALGGDKSIYKIILAAALVYMFILISYSINIYIHEVGHMVFGLLSGYKFNSIRFGKVIFVKKDGKIKRGIYNMPGTAGQCIMTAPDVDPKDMPVVLYNLGGLIVNLINFIIGFSLYLLLRNSHPVIGMLFMVFGMVALFVLVLNGLPFEQLGTDGANTIVLWRNVKSREIFRNSLEIMRYYSEGYSMQEMPPELMQFDMSTPMDNALLTSGAVNYYSYLVSTGDYEKAMETAGYILKNAKTINQLHKKLLYADLMFLNAVIKKDMEAARQIYKDHEKEINAGAGTITIQRDLYAYYTLVDIDKKKADIYAKAFAKSVKTNPYPKDAEMEQALFDMVGVYNK